MATSKDSKSSPQWPAPPASSAAPTSRPASAPVTDEFAEDADKGAPKSGRITHDERGNAVWNWAKNKGRAAIDSTSAVLKRLDLNDLKVEDEPHKGDPGKPASRDVGGGYNPYDQRSTVKNVLGNKQLPGIGKQPAPPPAPATPIKRK